MVIKKLSTAVETEPNLDECFFRIALMRQDDSGIYRPRVERELFQALQKSWQMASSCHIIRR